MDGGVLASLDGLKIQVPKEAGFLSIEAGRKTSAVHVYIGYTIVVRDVNRVQ